MTGCFLHPPLGINPNPLCTLERNRNRDASVRRPSSIHCAKPAKAMCLNSRCRLLLLRRLIGLRVRFPGTRRTAGLSADPSPAEADQPPRAPPRQGVPLPRLVADAELGSAVLQRPRFDFSALTCARPSGVRGRRIAGTWPLLSQEGRPWSRVTRHLPRHPRRTRRARPGVWPGRGSQREALLSAPPFPARLTPHFSSFCEFDFRTGNGSHTEPIPEHTGYHSALAAKRPQPHSPG